jgi:hypothetical protein
MEVQNFIASGGITGAIFVAGYVLYKICYKKKFRSKCCGAEMDMQDTNQSPKDDQPKTFDLPSVNPPTRANTPVLAASAPPDRQSIEIPALSV